MPELPEVETSRRHLAPAMEGRRIVTAEVRRNRMVRHHENPSDFALRITGMNVARLGRHGKFIVGDLVVDPDTAQPGAAGPDVVLVAHLGMSGRFSISSADEPEVPHTNVVLTLDDGVQIRLVDPRTFGFVHAYLPGELPDAPMARMGPDALTSLPRSPALSAALAGRQAPIKPLLLDQGIVAGLGNIYADEALHRARIAPQRPGGSLSPDEVKALRRAIVTTLADGIAWGGTSLDDLAYLLPDGRTGEFTRRLRVYGRTDAPCRRCGTPIQRAVLRQRSTHWCPQGQSQDPVVSSQ